MPCRMFAAFMPREYVSSSNLRSVGYDEWTGTLEVEFRNGGVYQLYDVPASLYHGLMDAGSKGSFYHDNLRSRYDYRRVH